MKTFQLIFVIYKTTHSTCNKLISLPDYRVKDIESFNKLKRNFQPLIMKCSSCIEKVEPTLVDVYVTEGLSVKPVAENLPIEKFAELKIE